MLKDIECKCEIIKNFAPSWFASVMGTGILAITSLFYSKYISFLKTIAHVLTYFNIILFFILLVPWLLRWIFFRKEAYRDLYNPVISNFYATLGVAMLVLSSNFIVILNNLSMGIIFWFIGVIVTILFGIIVPLIAFHGEHVKIDHINPGWFIPPVGLIVIPIAGSMIISHFSGFYRDLILLINYFSWGSGFFIYLFLSAICLYRFILHKPLPNTLAPTIWINLGPIGAGTIALINLIKNSPFLTLKEPFFVFSFLFWGFGLWWVIIAIITTLIYIKKLKLPYSMSWWAFVFPLGAYVAASYSIAKIFNIEIVNYIGFGLYWLLMFFWTITLVKTIIRTYHGSLFKSS
jgi:C4-dicarboxylate transporter/malic acid transport protein